MLFNQEDKKIERLLKNKIKTGLPRKIERRKEGRYREIERRRKDTRKRETLIECVCERERERERE